MPRTSGTFAFAASSTSPAVEDTVIDQDDFNTMMDDVETTFNNPDFAGSVTAHTNTAVPAGGTAGAGFLMSSTANLGIFFGSGAPTLAAAQGSIYIRTDGSSTTTRAYINTDGSTSWTSITTAA